MLACPDPLIKYGRDSKSVGRSDKYVFIYFMSKKAIIYKIVFSITETVIPSSINISSRERKDIIRETSEFNMSRINRMAVFLRVPIKIILHLFNLISILTIKKLFSSTSYSYRLKHIEQIKKIEILPLVDLIKLLRGLSLLNFYDNRLVRKSIDYEQNTP